MVLINEVEIIKGIFLTFNYEYFIEIFPGCEVSSASSYYTLSLNHQVCSYCIYCLGE